MRGLDPRVTEFDRYFFSELNIYRVKKKVGTRSDSKITHSRQVCLPTNLKHRSIEALVKELQI